MSKNLKIILGIIAGIITVAGIACAVISNSEDDLSF